MLKGVVMKKCPNCEIIMNEVIKINVTIDVCPKCMGIWLDKGELERIIANENNESNRNYRLDDENQHYQKFDHDDNKKDHYDHHDDHHSREIQYDKYGKPYKKRGGFSEILGGIFD